MQRLGVVLAILGLVQTLAPTLMRHIRPSLSISIRFRVSTLHSECGQVAVLTPPTVAPEGAQEGSAESTDSTEVLELESLCWFEGTETPRVVPRFSAAAEPVVIMPVPSSTDDPGQVRNASWTLGLARRAPTDRSTQLCRFLC
jgi:hypothetical protein